MPGFWLRLLISAAGLWLASELVSGIEIRGWGTLLIAAFLLGLVNALVRPLVVLLTLPITLLTLGLFLMVVNAGMLALVATLLGDFSVAGFGSALLGALVVSLTGWAANSLIGPKGQIEILVVRRP